MKTESQIKEAIARSNSDSEIVHITIDGDSGDALSAIHQVFDGDTDYAISDYEGIDTMDVWGFDEDSPEGQMTWRLAIRFKGNE